VTIVQALPVLIDKTVPHASQELNKSSTPCY